jgi:restriction system protein
VSPGGYGEVPSLEECESLAETRAVVAKALPDASENSTNAYGSQLWALRNRMRPGDYIVLPRKTTAQPAIGRILSDYRYDASEPDQERRHVRQVQWLRTDVPRSAVRQDLLYSLGAFSTYCEVSRNEAAARIAALAETGVDPGSKIADVRRPQKTSETSDEPEDGVIDLEEHAQGRIAALIQERFAGHKMAVLVESLLTAQGYTCWRSPEGADGGIDILAGSGPLGLEAPQLVVQVKSEQGAVGDPVLSQLIGTTTKHGSAARGLLVAWGGLTQQAARSARDNYFRLRVWTAVDVISQITQHYDSLPEEIRTDLPLKQIWIAVEDNA